jgi:hypothetical protein
MDENNLKLSTCPLETFQMLGIDSGPSKVPVILNQPVTYIDNSP